MNMFEWHVKLIMQQDSVSANAAKMRAWLGGPADYEKRLEKANG